MTRNANYELLGTNADVMVIRDVGPWDKHPTVTNDAAWVVYSLVPLLGNRRLFYHDSDGRLDELLIANGRFVGFAPAPHPWPFGAVRREG